VKNLKVIDTLKEIGLKSPTEIDKSPSNEQINFNNRPPIFKALMKLEFEKAIREYLKEL
jgi:hypothetical protein